MIKNPILPGFNPDPSICRVGDEYFIATSTFEWYPGVQIHRSLDLSTWALVSRPLRRPSQLDMRGNPDSCGIWAPCLSYADDRFWLVYTDVKRLDGAFKDAHNYIVACDTIDGDWSDPWYVNSSGFDPSLFHDDDGRKWFVNMRWNHRHAGSGVNKAHDRFDGILLQEWSPEKGLIGSVTNIYDGTSLGLTEAPHIFKRNGWYYLTTAEGGTGYEHAVTLARSRNITGPYENHPEQHVITAAGHPEHPIQRTGHGQYVEAADGTAWHTFLMGRPMEDPSGRKRFCQMGRETGLARCKWKDDWLYLEGEGALPPEIIDADTVLAVRPPVVHDRFEELPAEFQWLRTPYPDRLFRIEDGALILTGRESIGSWFEQSLVARRQEDHTYTAETAFGFEPKTYQQGAGLITYYNRTKFHAVFVTSEGGARRLTVMSCEGDYPEGDLTYHTPDGLEIPDGDVVLSVTVESGRQQFFVGSGESRRKIGPELDAFIISDEGGRGEHASFTGAFVGMFAFDITGQGAEARFTRFGYWPDVSVGAAN